LYSPVAVICSARHEAVQEDRPKTILQTQNSVESVSMVPRYYRWCCIFFYYHGITVMFVPVTVTTAVKYIVMSPLLWYYQGITVVPITMQLCTLDCVCYVWLTHSSIFLLHFCT